MKRGLLSGLIMISLFLCDLDLFAQQISISVQNATVTEVISQIKKQTDYDFLYNNETLKEALPITVKTSNLSLKKTLDICFINQPFNYKIRKKMVLITAMKKNISITDSAAKIQVLKGLVRDSLSAEPLDGVTIKLEGTRSGTFSDAAGTFSIGRTGEEAILSLSYMGYKTLKIKVGADQQIINARLVKSETPLEEVVVIGYGSRNRDAVTGAIATLSSVAFENRAINNTMEALQGTIPGVTVTRASGRPGSQGYQLQTRGYSSINGNAPLVMVDGVPGDLYLLNPNDIAEVTVLKDAGASIYGSRAADGVVLVTTKKGISGPPLISYSFNYGYKTPQYLRKIVNTLQFAEMLNDGLHNVGQPGFTDEVFEKIKQNAATDLSSGWNYGVTGYPSFYGNVVWNDVVFKSAAQQLHNLSITGGSGRNSYLLSLGYNRDDGNVNFADNNVNRFNMRLNYDFKLTKDISLETRATFDNQLISEPSQLSVALQNVPRMMPYQPVYNSVGQFYGYQGYQNPAQSLNEGGRRSVNYSRYGVNFKIDYHILDYLKLTSQASLKMDYNFDNANYRTFNRWNYAGEVQDVRNNPNSAYYTNGKSMSKLVQAYLEYAKTFGEDHSLSLMAGGSFEKNDAEGQTTWGYNFLSNDIFTLNLADRSKTAYSNFTGHLNNSAMSSYFGRFNYSYHDKLIADITARTDGSSKFAPNKRWSSLFPSFSLAYILSEENFLKTNGTIDLLKFRLSWGKTGNQEINQLGLYDYIPLISVDGNYPLGSPNARQASASLNPVSAQRTWETIENRNAGLDALFFNSRLSFSLDYFNKINDNMLVGIAVPSTYGNAAPVSNQGKLLTKGFETSLAWRDHFNEFKYGISIQISDNKNKLLELKNSDNYKEGLNYARQGYSMYSYFGYAYAGIIQTEEQLEQYRQLQGIPVRLSIGDVMYADLDGDGKLTPFGDKAGAGNGDMKYLGNLLPRYTFSSNVNLSYRNFDFMVFLQGVGKRNLKYTGPISTPNYFFWPSLEYYHNRTWTPERTDAQFPRYIAGGLGYDDVRDYNYRTSALVMQNAAYLRVKTITLGYNLPALAASKLRMKTARVYLSGQDLLTFSRGTMGGSFDPEDGFRNEGTYPFNKVFSMGINAKF